MTQTRVQSPDGPFEPTWESLKQYTVPQWYLDGKFGIFVHWGPYCVPGFGNEWYPRHMYQEGSKEFEHHVKTFGQQSEFGYKDFISMFTAERFSAERWANLLANSGAKFVVPVAEHHDGFAMYDSSFSKWCATNMGPRRDIVGELAAAVREKGMVFGVSTHRAAVGADPTAVEPPNDLLARQESELKLRNTLCHRGDASESRPRWLSHACIRRIPTSNFLPS